MAQEGEASQTRRMGSGPLMPLGMSFAEVRLILSGGAIVSDDHPYKSITEGRGVSSANPRAENEAGLRAVF